MTKKQFPSDTYIIDCLNANFAIKAQIVTPILEGADMNAITYKAQTSNNSYFVKVKHDCNNESNTTILELLHGSGIQQIIPPVKSIHSNSIIHVDNFSLIVYPFIEGVNGFSYKLTNKQWTILGKALRQVHDFTVPSPLLQHIKHETYCPKWRQTVRLLYQCIEDKLPGDDLIRSQFLNFMKEHKPVILRLVDRAEELSDSIKKQPTKLVLCHSDIHGGNVLISKGDSIYIVDWDDPIMAPKERDLMFIGGGVANIWNDPQEEASFYKGYGNTDINISLLSYYRYERIVQDIAEYAEALLLSKLESTQKDRLEMYTQFVDMFNPQGVVDIAFKTDRAS